MMRLGALWLGLLLFGHAASSLAFDRHPARRSDLDVVVPVVPEEHERLHFFDGRDHHVVPGSVTINGSPYICDRDGARFEDRDVFLFHLRTAHGVEPARVPRLLMLRRGRVHFVGE